MIKKYTVVDGDKAQFIYEGHEFTFTCDEKDIDTAYDALAENLDLVNYDLYEDGDDTDLVAFQNAKDDDAATMLDDMQRMGFIDYWEAKEVED